ncbi:MAG TPA: hypothetical protein VIQ74_05185 [Gemmatimonadaceae bacterium]
MRPTVSGHGRRSGLIRLATAILLLCLSACSGSEQQSASNDVGGSCKMTAAQKQQSVTAFLAMMPAFNHPRCANCHGGIDVYAPSAKETHGGGQQDMKTVVDSEDFNGGLGPVHVTQEPDPSQCEACHDEVDGWSQPDPMERFAFVGRSPSQICEQIKHKDSPSAFALHVAHDVLVLAGFEGKRGQSDLTPKPPPMTLAEFQARAATWEKSLRDPSQNDDWYGGMESDCGCVPEGGGYRITEHQRTVSEKQGLGEDITYVADVTVDSTGEEYVGSGTYYGTVVTQKLNCHNDLPIDRKVHPVSGMLEASANDTKLGSKTLMNYTLTTTDWPVSLTIFAMGSGPGRPLSADDEATAHKMHGDTRLLMKLTGPKTVVHETKEDDGRMSGYMPGCAGKVTHTTDITVEEIR